MMHTRRNIFHVRPIGPNHYTPARLICKPRVETASGKFAEYAPIIRGNHALYLSLARQNRIRGMGGYPCSEDSRHSLLLQSYHDGYQFYSTLVGVYLCYLEKEESLLIWFENTCGVNKEKLHDKFGISEILVTVNEYILPDNSYLVASLCGLSYLRVVISYEDGHRDEHYCELDLYGSFCPISAGLTGEAQELLSKNLAVHPTEFTDATRYPAVVKLSDDATKTKDHEDAMAKRLGKEYKGYWVALKGKRVVGSAETLNDLKNMLGDKFNEEILLKNLT